VVSRRDGSSANTAASAGVRSARGLAGPPVTASGYVTVQIRDGILNGAFPLGSRLDQQVLADEMGVSTIPVREALRHLEALGLVRIHPRRGAFVAELSPSEQDEIGRIREPLEEQAIRLAATRIDESQRAVLDDLIVRMDNATTSGAWNEANREWHMTLYRAADSPLLLELISTLWDRSILYRHVYAEQEQSRATSNAEHREMLRQISAGNGAGAGRLIRKHIRRPRKEMRRREAAADEEGIRPLRPA
jgi:DNA-binding GntR family transcriptional regulator